MGSREKGENQLKSASSRPSFVMVTETVSMDQMRKTAVSLNCYLHLKRQIKTQSFNKLELLCSYYVGMLVRVVLKSIVIST